MKKSELFRAVGQNSAKVTAWTITGNSEVILEVPAKSGGRQVRWFHFELTGYILERLTAACAGAADYAGAGGTPADYI
jgi:hypothetical protein